MPIDDHEFERYLKQFCPLEPAAFPSNRSSRSRKALLLAACGVIAAAVLAGVMFSIPSRPNKAGLSRAEQGPAASRQLANPQLLTIRGANALLATAPSFEAAVNKMMFQPPPVPLAKDRQSALAVLSEEKIKI